MHKRTFWVLIAIVALAALIRLPALDRIPPGVYPDEAINGVQGWEAARTGNFKMFYPENNGREGLWINLIGVTEQLIGPTPVALRLWSAVAGILTVLGLFFFARELLGKDSIALASAFLLSTSFWHINFSRISFPAILGPLFLTWAFALLLCAWRIAGPQGNVRAWLAAIAGGVVFGLGFYSYIAYRVAPLLAVAVVFLMRHRHTHIRRMFAWLAGAWTCAAALTVTPLAIYFLNNRQDFFNRATQVSILGTPHPAVTFLKGAVRTACMFNFRGDLNPRHNMPGWPELLFPVGLLFLAGIGVALHAIFSAKSAAGRAGEYAVLLIWMAVLALPEILTREGIPHSLRAIGTIPPVMILAAAGADSICRKWNTRMMRIILATVLVLSGGIEIYRYFMVWARDPGTSTAFSQPLVRMAAYFNTLPSTTARFIIANSPGATVPHTNADGAFRNISVSAETVLFETLLFPQATYLVAGDLGTYPFPHGSVVAPLENDPAIFQTLRSRGYHVNVESKPHFSYALIE